MGLIIRTVAVGQSEETLAADAKYLVRLWQSILARFKLKNKGTALLYRDADLIIRIVRDSFTDDVDEFLIDDAQVYQRVIDLVKFISPHLLARIKLYQGAKPLFKEYGIVKEDE